MELTRHLRRSSLSINQSRLDQPPSSAVLYALATISACSQRSMFLAIGDQIAAGVLVCSVSAKQGWALLNSA